MVVHYRMRFSDAVRMAVFMAMTTCLSCGEAEFTRDTELYVQPPVIVLNPVGPASQHYQQGGARGGSELTIDTGGEKVGWAIGLSS